MWSPRAPATGRWGGRWGSRTAASSRSSTPGGREPGSGRIAGAPDQAWAVPTAEETIKAVTFLKAVIFLTVPFPAAALIGWGGSGAPSELSDKASEYLDASGTASEEAPYLRSKVVPVDVDSGEIDGDVYEKLPEELRAASPDEVGTVVKLDYDSEQVGEYDDGGNAYQEEAVVDIVDVEQGILFDSAELINGPDPPEAKSGGGDRSGGKPDDEIVDYLMGLPRAGPGETPVQTSSKDVVIRLTDKGVEPRLVRAELGDRLVVRNVSQRPHDLAVITLTKFEKPGSVNLQQELEALRLRREQLESEDIPDEARQSIEEGIALMGAATPVISPGDSYEIPVEGPLVIPLTTEDPYMRAGDARSLLVPASDYAPGQRVARLVVTPDSGGK